MENNVTCLNCHGDWRFDEELRGAELEAMCKSCHNLLGMAANMSDVSNHIVSDGNNGTTIIDCAYCHRSHGPYPVVDSHPGGTVAFNLNLVRKSIRKYVPQAQQVTVFHQKPDHFAFEESNPPYNGVCQTCHTQTTHHTNDANGDHEHYIGESCVSCHTHKSGFMPGGSGGSCTGCHGSAQDNGDGIPAGGRRAVATEFPEGSDHAHYGAQLDDAACLVCHSMETHQDGYVELIDPDNGSIYRFVKTEDITSDPDLSNFCMGCHDSNGATRLATPLDPFGSGNASKEVASRFMGTLQWNEWYGDFCFGQEGTLRAVNSHHDISDNDQAFSGAKLECLNCHGSHNVSASQPLADPFDTTANWSGDLNSFCLTCHSGGIDPNTPNFPDGVIGPAIAMRGLDSCNYNMSPWYVDYTWTNAAHGKDSKRAWEGYSDAPGYELKCDDCHDPHGSYTQDNTQGNPYMIRDVVDGSAYVDDGVRPSAQWTGPPWETFGTVRNVKVTIDGTQVDWGSEQSLCSTCHTNWRASYDWHDYCDGCQTCHGHGQAWQNYDWGPTPQDDQSCSIQAQAADENILSSHLPSRSFSEPKQNSMPIHFNAKR
jgi:hypothetical protein